MQSELFDKQKAEKILNMYPQLEVLLQAGMVSKKMCREILDIDKWLMDDLYKDMLLAGMIKGTSSSCFRAKEDTLLLIKKRKGE